MSGNPRRNGRPVERCAPVVGRHKGRPVLLVTNDNVRFDAGGVVWALRCPFCRRIHRYKPRLGLHPSKCAYSPSHPERPEYAVYLTDNRRRVPRHDSGELEPDDTPS